MANWKSPASPAWSTPVPGHLTFLANPKYAPKVKHTKAAAILVSDSRSPDCRIACLVSDNPYLDFARALALFYQPPRPAPGIHPLAYVAPTAEIGENCSIGPFAVVGERVRIGRNAVLHPHVVIYEGAEIGDDFLAHSHAAVREFCRIGHRVTLQNGVVVGGDGFGFAKRADGTHFKIVQSRRHRHRGRRRGPEPDLGRPRHRRARRACSRGAKIDSLVQIGHACVVGEDNIICAQTGLAGSTVLERNVLLAGQVGSSGHLTVHEGAIVYAQSGIGGDVAPAPASPDRPPSPRRVAARRHRLSQVAGIAQVRARVEEESRRAGTRMPNKPIEPPQIAIGGPSPT